MISIFNRSLLMTDSNAEELARVVEILKNNYIDYEIKTIRNRGAIGISMDVGAYPKANLSYDYNRQQLKFIYKVFVHRDDYSLARQLVYGQ